MEAGFLIVLGTDLWDEHERGEITESLPGELYRFASPSVCTESHNGAFKWFFTDSEEQFLIIEHGRGAFFWLVVLSLCIIFSTRFPFYSLTSTSKKKLVISLIDISGLIKGKVSL